MGSRGCGTRHRMGGTRFRVLTRGLGIGGWGLVNGYWGLGIREWWRQSLQIMLKTIEQRLMALEAEAQSFTF